MTKPNTTLAAPSKKPQKAAAPKADAIEQSTAAASGDYLKKPVPGTKVLMNVKIDAEFHQEVKIWAAEHNTNMTTMAIEGIKLFMKLKGAK